MNFETKIYAGFIEQVQDGEPTSGQLIKSCFNQSGRTLGPWINVWPSQCPRKGSMGLQAQICRCFGREPQLLDCPGLPSFGVAADFRGSESIKQNVVRRMNRHQLTLQMGRKLGEL